MFRGLTFAIVCIAVSASMGPLPDDAPLLTDEEIEAINAAGYWVADKTLIEGKTLGDLRRHRRPHYENEAPVPEYKWGTLLEHLTLPASFDSRTQWPSCTQAILSEGDCDGSWALAAVDTLSHRFCTQVQQQVILSPQYLLDCQTQAGGCDGGTPANAWSYLASQGSCKATCLPFKSTVDSSCPVKCSNGTPLTKYKSTSPQTFVGSASMQAAIAQYGPIQACFQLYTDFYSYRSGVYVHTTGGTSIGTECLKLVGWGTQGSLTYWIGAAYQGTSWGQSGYIYFKMGQLSIESGAVAANPVA